MASNFSDTFEPVPPKKGGIGKIIAIVVGIIGLMFLLCCGGGFAFVGWGLNMIAQETQNQVEGNPIIVEHIGVIEKFKTNLTKSGAAGGDDTFVYDIEGSKGSGTLTATTKDEFDGASIVTEATLRLKDGRKFELDMSAVAAEEDFQEI